MAARLVTFRHLKGFTLLEALMSLSLFSILMTLLLTAMFTIGKTAAAGQRLADLNDDRRLVIGFIQRLIAQAEPVKNTASASHSVIFDGSESQLMFISYLPAHLAGNGLFQVKLTVQDSGEHKDLMLHYRPLASLSSAAPAAYQQQKLLTNIASIDFQYFSMANADASQPLWRGGRQLPALVKFTISSGQPAWQLKPVSVYIPAKVVRLRSHQNLYAPQL